MQIHHVKTGSITVALYDTNLHPLIFETVRRAYAIYNNNNTYKIQA